jgi:hypothetical protein
MPLTGKKVQDAAWTVREKLGGLDPSVAAAILGALGVSATAKWYSNGRPAPPRTASRADIEQWYWEHPPGGNRDYRNPGPAPRVPTVISDADAQSLGVHAANSHSPLGHMSSDVRHPQQGEFMVEDHSAPTICRGAVAGEFPSPSILSVSNGKKKGKSTRALKALLGQVFAPRHGQVVNIAIGTPDVKSPDSEADEYLQVLGVSTTCTWNDRLSSIYDSYTNLPADIMEQMGAYITAAGNLQELVTAYLNDFNLRRRNAAIEQRQKQEEEAVLEAKFKQTMFARLALDEMMLKAPRNPSPAQTSIERHNDSSFLKPDDPVALKRKGR